MAFFELMGWEEGNFSIFYGQSTNEVNVTTDTMRLLLEASRIIDERKTVKEQQMEKLSEV
jgi:hypothetical protein